MTDLSEKFTHSVPSFKVIGTDTDRSAAYDFLPMFHSNYGLSRTVAEETACVSAQIDTAHLVSAQTTRRHSGGSRISVPLPRKILKLSS